MSIVHEKEGKEKKTRKNCVGWNLEPGILGIFCGRAANIDKPPQTVGRIDILLLYCTCYYSYKTLIYKTLFAALRIVDKC